MAILRTECGSCGQAFEFPPEEAGILVLCPNCGDKVLLRRPGQTPSRKALLVSLVATGIVVFGFLFANTYRGILWDWDYEEATLKKPFDYGWSLRKSADPALLPDP